MNGSYIEMSPEEIQKLLVGHKSILDDEIKKEEVFFRHSSCPNCGALSCQPFLDIRNPFSQGQALPNRLLRCVQCSTEFNPYTRLIMKVSAANQVDSVSHR